MGGETTWVGSRVAGPTFLNTLWQCSSRICYLSSISVVSGASLEDNPCSLSRSSFNKFLNIVVDILLF